MVQTETEIDVPLEKLELDASVEAFLSDCKASSAKTYRSRLYVHFIPFLKSYVFDGEVVGTSDRFLDLVSADQAKAKREKRFVARAILNDFAKHLSTTGLSPNSVNAVFGAIHSLGKYYEVPISNKFLKEIPAPIAQTKSFAWTIEAFEKFSVLLEKPMYRALDACSFQSSLGIKDLLGLTYGKIQREFEAGIVPLCLSCVRQKTSVEHRTFLGPESIQLLKAYFDLEGTPEPEEKIFPVTARTVQAVFANRAHKLIGDWPYRNPLGIHSRRKFFRKQLVKVGECPSEFAEYFMAHKLKADIRKTYSEMSDDEWRDVYRKYMRYLSFRIFPVEKTREKTKRRT